MLPGGEVNVGAAAAVTVIILEAVNDLPQASVNVHVSVTVPPQGPGNVPSVDVTEPLIRHVPLAPLV